MQRHGVRRVHHASHDLVSLAVEDTVYDALAGGPASGMQLLVAVLVLLDAADGRLVGLHRSHEHRHD